MVVPNRLWDWWRAVAILLFAGMVANSMGQAVAPAERQFPPGSLNSLEDLPPGRFRDQVQALPPATRERALAWLRSFHFTEQDLGSLHVDANGGVLYVDDFELNADGPAPAESDPEMAAATVPVSPFPSHLIFHSRPGAPNVLYLNFCGENVSNTEWNNVVGRSVIPALAFSTDSDYSTFSDAEQAAIKRIWQRVAEDFAPFNINVTTERPGTFNSRTAHALITRNTDANGDPNPYSNSGGVAYVNVFNTATYAKYRPAWVYHNNLGNNEAHIAEAASHEIGHNLGLSHDGRTDGQEYYGGHGSGETSWGPLMGTGYNRNVSQWCKGEYYNANNTQDDLAIIASKISYRADDHGNTAASASGLVITGGTNVVSTTPETDPANTNSANKGVLEANTDVDVFTFVTGTGPIHLEVRPWVTPSGTRGGNLDVRLELYSSGGALLMTNNPASQTSAVIQTNLPEGSYFLHVKNTGTGDPMSSTPSGYTGYGSIGQFFISGYVTASAGLVLPPLAELQVTDITQPSTGAKQFAVRYSDNLAIDVATIDHQDVRVTGPGGYDRSAQLVSIDVLSNGTPRTATYSVNPPSGSEWTAAHNGTYTVWMGTNQVADVEGAWVAAGALGQFSVNVPTAIYFASMEADPGWTLEPQWQYGQPNYSGAGPVSGYTGTKIIGYNLSGNYGDRLSAKYATTPPINCSGASSLTLRFYRWLRIRNGDTASVQVSTNGIAWTDVWISPGTVADSNWEEVQYALPSWAAGSPTVRLRWGIESNPAQNDIGWNIDDVLVLGGGILDVAPPNAVLNVSDVTSAGSPSHSLSVTFTDDSGVRVSSLGNGDLVVTGPNSFSNLVEFAGVDVPTDGTPRTATYSVAAPGGNWDTADNGTYQVSLVAGEVEDVFNNALPQLTLGSFSVAVPTNQQAILVEPVSMTVVEGSNAVLVVRLAEQPTAPIVVTTVRVSGDSDLVIQSGATNTLDSSNWSAGATVVLAALPDADQDSGSAVFECRADGLPAVSVFVTEQDTTPDVTLLVHVNNPAWGSAGPAGTYPVGSTVEIVASPTNYFEFGNWSGNVHALTNPLVLVLNSNVTVQANFQEVLTTNYLVPHWWLAAQGYTNDFEGVVTQVGANGMMLWQSYVAGLDPQDPASVLRLEIRFLGEGGATVLNWNTVTGRVYSIWTTTNLLQNFTPVDGATNLPWTVQSLTNSVESSNLETFYRLEVIKP